MIDFLFLSQYFKRSLIEKIWKKTRIESDSLGKVKVPSEHYWGAQTQRSLENFKIGTEKCQTLLLEH